jgi:hypothetical protein
VPFIYRLNANAEALTIVQLDNEIVRIRRVDKIDTSIILGTLIAVIVKSNDGAAFKMMAQ